MQTKFAPARDVAASRKATPRPAYREPVAIKSNHRRDVHSAITRVAQSAGFTLSESIVIASAALAKCSGDANLAERATQQYSLIADGSEPLPAIVRLGGSAPSARWLEAAARPAWIGKYYDAERAA